MFRIITIVFAIIFILPVSAKAESYLDMKIPVMDGAKNVSEERNDEFYMKTISYDLTFEDTQSIFHFYDHFFREQGWKNFMEGHPQVKHTWSSRASRFDLDGKPIFAVSTMWQLDGTPVNGSVNVTVKEYNEPNFLGEIQLSVSPDMTNAMMSNDSLNLSGLLDKPKDIFIMHRAFGDNPMQLENVDFSKVPEELKNDPVIVEYKKHIDAWHDLYEDYGAQYIHKTKSVDGKFERKEYPKTDPLVPPVGDSGEETEDPLHRWRLLQEERVEREMEARQSKDCPKPTFWQCITGQ